MTTATVELLATAVTLPLVAAALVAAVVIVVALRDDSRGDPDPDPEGATVEFADLLQQLREAIAADGRHGHAPGRMSARRLLRTLGRRIERGTGGRHRLGHVPGASAQAGVVWA